MRMLGGSKRKSRCIAGVAMGTMFLIGIVHAQSYNLYVTYYDFHENGTNPNFECGGLPQCNAYTADLTLDSEKKPVSTCTEVKLAKWFRPWTPGDTLEVSQVADTIYGTVPIGRRLDTAMTALLGDSSWIEVFDTTVIQAGVIRSDTLYKNAVVQDSIQMIKEAGSNFYRMKNSDDSTDSWWGTSHILFFPLDGNGFESLGYPRSPTNDAKNHKDRGEHNYCFAMEMHARFIYKGGEKIYISGKGNKWIYLNNTRIYEKRLHNENELSLDTFSLDTFNLTVNDTVSFDLFDVDNKTPDHMLGFTTNIIFLPQPKPVVGIIDTRKNVSVPGSKIVSIGKGINLRVPAQANKINVLVSDVTGRIMVHGNALTISRQMGLLPTGMFLVKASCADDKGHSLGTIVSKVVVSKR